jgi:two-component system phosphate regulon sensor histidine kinase PhoR
MRVTLIAPDGSVLFDNEVEASTLENHAGRSEVQAALQTGFGESERYSSTSRSSIYYVALRLSDGNVLRFSRSLESILSVFATSLVGVLWILILAAVLALFLSEYLSRAVVRPINRLSSELDRLIAQATSRFTMNLNPSPASCGSFRKATET